MPQRTCPQRLTAFAMFLLAALPAAGQRNRITAPIRNDQRATLAGHVPAQIGAGEDRGRVAPDLELRSMTLVLKPSPAQQADLDSLLARQQDPSSPDYHH